MKACGLIVEYNPFHNGHVYHLEQSKQETQADVMVAVMSGSFLQRGEPAIIDKFHRAKAALTSGVDILLELPYVYAVQYADLFAKGAMLQLDGLNVDDVCFGSEEGNIEPFLEGYDHYLQEKSLYQSTLHKYLDDGLSFPQASKKAYESINLTQGEIDLSQPNNILGFSYVKAVKELKSSINPRTIRRTKSGYHDPKIEHEIASATSIRNEILTSQEMTRNAINALPQSTTDQLLAYQQKSGSWHSWESYFPYLQLIVHTRSVEELSQIHGVIEGLEYRLKQTVQEAENFEQWMHLLKTKRYTWTRLQRMFAHILTNTTKNEVNEFDQLEQAPYLRILGMTDNGRNYIKSIKKDLEIPIFSNLQEHQHDMLNIEERATNAYYAPIPTPKRKQLKKQELTGPIKLF
ncbi:nucleotidyltransferase [Aquisalibacillus elongatus]|uniref:tRNA(Met) cytidine acetate ligase n=1 Tax=Aquisalibacillus elongatus TaxID=485577 RepID=A0A3N5BF55_9BACI|nr:nucleotidyltransferase [Aquisalibacillus elongatus]RPF56097.1 putative nucleotidyltransferase [Aquisalibacillus elongatus]